MLMMMAVLLKGFEMTKAARYPPPTGQYLDVRMNEAWISGRNNLEDSRH